MRRDKNNHYLDIAETISQRGTCLRRNFGSVIVKNDEIISTGYSGAPRGRINCTDAGRCTRVVFNIPRGTRYEMCRSVHAEANSIISSARKDMIGSTLFLVGIEVESGNIVEKACACTMCKRLIINAGIDKVVVRNTKTDYTIIDVTEWIENDESLTSIEGY